MAISKKRIEELDRISENLKHRCRSWTAEEEEILVAYYERIGRAGMSEYLGRSIGSVGNKWIELKAKRKEG